MRAWAEMLGGMLVWAFHFFALYIAVSLLGPTAMMRLLAALLTVAALLADAWLLLRACRALRAPRDGAITQWRDQISLFTAALSGVAVVWQGLPLIML